MSAPRADIGRAALHPQRLAGRAIDNPGLVESILAGLSCTTPRVKYGCARTLRFLSETRPDVLYPRFDDFARLLDHENHILQWDAAMVLSRLAGVDAGNKFAAIFEKYFAPISGPVMITAATVIRGGPLIARAKPAWADRVAARVLKVGRARYQTAECRNVAIGHAILALEDIFGLLRRPAAVVRFVRGQLKNPRAATRRKAERFLKRFSPSAKSHPTSRRRPGR